MTPLLLSLWLALADVPATPAPAGLAFSGVVERVGAALILRVVLENRAAAPVWVAGRLDFEDQDCCHTPETAVQIVLHDVRGRRLRTRCRPLPPDPRVQHRALAPGARFTASYSLSSCYSFDPRETIKLRLSYRDPGSFQAPGQPPSPPAGVTAPPRQVDGGEVRFTTP